jgi:hypothetical protein
VVAVSNSEQQRETLAIMLDSDFEVAAAATPSSASLWLDPAAVVLSPSPWDAAVAPLARQRWPQAGMILVDAPRSVQAQFRDAGVASWSDPFSVPEAVANVVRRPPPLSADALASAVREAEIALRPALEQTVALAALAQAASRPASIDIAAHFLAERLSGLLDLLAWVEWFTEDSGEDVSDLAAALRQAVEERQLRALCRGLEFHWRSEDGTCLLDCARLRALALARCLRSALFALAPGDVSVAAHARGLRCEHPGVGEEFATLFVVEVATRLLRQVGARLHITQGSLAIDLSHGPARA